jgi:hypothetical protein
MSGRFSNDLQKMTVRLIYQLAALVKMPAIGVRIDPKSPSKPIVISDKMDHHRFCKLSISTFLDLDVEKAIVKGGTLDDLMHSKRVTSVVSPKWDMEPVETETIEQAMAALGLPQSK